MTDTSEPGISTPERPYQMFEITVQCNACGTQFTQQQGDQNPKDAQTNIIFGLTLGHGNGFDETEEMTLCSAGGGKEAKDYTVISCTPIAS